MEFYYSKQSEWLEKAMQLKPQLQETEILPVAMIKTEQADDAWQGTVVTTNQYDEYSPYEWYHWARDWQFDFGRHIVGTVELVIEAREYNDAPLRIDYKFAETQYELATSFSTYHGHLDRSWLQDGVEIIDELPPPGETLTIRLPRRFAFRYLKFRTGSPNFDIRIHSIKAFAFSSADDSAYTPSVPGKLTQTEVAIEKRAAWTLHECMQYMFEDGPKRDRRLWLGDLRIQALVNGVTYRNFRLVERCLYIFAALAKPENGALYGAAFERQDGIHPSCAVQTYALLFGPALYEHWLFTHNTDFCRELFEVALRQIEIIRPLITDDANIVNGGKGCWFFVDHDDNLKDLSAAVAIYIFSMRKVAALGEAIDMPHPELNEEADRICAKLYDRCYDEKEGMFGAEGPGTQFSWATQIWFLLAGVPKSHEQAVTVWKNMLNSKNILRPRTPYLWCSAVEAALLIGEKDDARKLITEYWGAMNKIPGDTYPEFFDPEAPFYSSYGDCLMNSECHAWSCGAAYFLKTMDL